MVFFFSSRRRHTIFDCDWSSDVCSSDLLFDIRATEANCLRMNFHHWQRRRHAFLAAAATEFSHATDWHLEICCNVINVPNFIMLHCLLSEPKKNPNSRCRSGTWITQPERCVYLNLWTGSQAGSHVAEWR